VTRLLLRIKAEVVLGVLLVVRHRTARFMALLAVLVFGASAAAGGGNGYQSSLLVVAGSLAAVGSSRLLAPGPALAALRSAAPAWWLGPAARLAGSLLVVGAVTGTGAVVLVVPEDGWRAALGAGGAAWLLAAAVGAPTAAAAPLTGATAAGTLAMASVWLGGIAPSGMADLLSPWPILARPVVLCWNVLPLGWRAARWGLEGGGANALVLATWVGIGVAGAGWTAAAAYRADGARAGAT
jgi:hypothetical protein